MKYVIIEAIIFDGKYVIGKTKKGTYVIIVKDRIPFFNGQEFFEVFPNA